MSVAEPTVLADAAFPRVSTAVRNTALVLGGAVFVGIAAQVAIPLPFTPVPVTGQTFAVLLTGAAFGMRRAIASMLLYLAGALAGIPWMSNHGAAVRNGAVVPSFGYVVGFVFAVAAVGWLAERGWTRTSGRTAALFALGNVIIYSFGLSWLRFALGITWRKAVELGAIPFLAGDAIKILAAAALLPFAWTAVQRFAKN